MATRMMPVTPAPIAFRLVWNPCAILTVPFPTVLDSLWKEEIKSRANRTAPTTSNRMPMPRTTALTRRDFIDDACGSNIVISRIFSAYFLRFPLISAANAEEESAFFGGSFGQNRRFSKGRKAILRAGAAAAQVARPCPRRAAGKSLFGADRRGIRGLDSAIYSLSQQ